MIKCVPGRIEVYRDMDVSSETVWDIITDTARWIEWGPSIMAVECQDRYIQKRSRGRVQTAIGLWVHYEITAFDEGKYWSWRVFGIPATGHRVVPQGDDICRLIFEMPFLAAPYAYVCKIALKRIARIVEKRNVIYKV
ncbi:MAG: SRPBCC family protein [Candidatus Scalindua sp. AMX11]|nr:MAG: SRPBCC family protein [Candidatus Scalindua sp.]NOG84920.1 SRPBCC family protein [Planctomycetota bacterium]RZV84983.1 MAG: SRPBCC family protein [Candidatus Scalindua sp. SCAELEC01]TDE65023.1 MAG: SRPBCC family protein [Candidatus Scalindua sp. AMX11]GJQ59414.1 MAG: hypothetical protein SCALA701_22150 [Candidatus Scalindua sp.]